MCAPSVVADDWITKGCHIKVNGIELAVRPDHRGSIVFQSVFSTPSSAAVNEAIRTALRDCLPDPDVRRAWIRKVEGAMVHLISESGDLREKALGRLAELNFLMVALKRFAG
jgi:hypothetical protein